ncbi:hypothetical protein [Calycomorphotria hydatis]|uniref:Transmembrane protein n=1 Tax=Calycomorphotria hydatis TaxID=2528027 RepID=A0A517TBJ5_9PLAN|nr:hypothetical protein [Calycomorphotria hydatis]QDT65737.1 hypothetical protein V22_29970 [Calycomorphotria hydatis]
MRFNLGIVIAAIALYAFGFLYWGVSPFGTFVWERPKDPEAVRAFLKEHFPENRTYGIPVFPAPDGGEDAKNEFAKAHAEGPVAIVHMTNVDGRPALDSSIMIKGFILNAICIMLVANIMKFVVTSLPTYISRLLFVLSLGLLVAIFTQAGDIVWWKIDWQWKSYIAVYDLGSFLIIGAILAHYISPEDKQKSSSKEKKKK